MFTYDFSNSPRLANVRLLIGDTVGDGHIWEDEEIYAAYAIQSSAWQSSMLYSNGSGATLPSVPASPYRVAALLLDSLASNKARLGAIRQMLGTTFDFAVVAKTLHEQAAAWREVEDNCGAFAIIEQTHTTFAFRDRYFKEIQRRGL